MLRALDPNVSLAAEGRVGLRFKLIHAPRTGVRVSLSRTCVGRS